MAEERSYFGMTVNERLVLSGLIEAWDAAVRDRDRATMIAVLEAVHLGNPGDIADRVLADPANYGF